MLKLLGRKNPLFSSDISSSESRLCEEILRSKFLVLGGAGSIGQAVVKEIFKRQPKALHVVDLSENNLTELVRDIRSSFGYISGDFQTYALDIASAEFDAFIVNGTGYDYVLNLSALKHVRSEKDPYTLMRMVQTNIFNTEKTLRQAIEFGAKKYFCVSTDKAANPVNMMGASKRIMEFFVHKHSQEIQVSMARFANVAFSDGSLLHGFNQRIQKKQPIAAPNDIKRYFVTPQESGELCLMSCIFGENRDIFFPKLSEKLHLITFAEIAKKYLKQLGYEPYLCASEEEARTFFASQQHLENPKFWPCYFSGSDTTGEKDFEEFFTVNEQLDMSRFNSIGVIQNELDFEPVKLTQFEQSIAEMHAQKRWTRMDIIQSFERLLPSFQHKEAGKFLDSKM